MYYKEYAPSNIKHSNPVTWANVWLLAQIIIIFQALQFASGMKVQVLVIALIALWFIRLINKID